MPTRRKRNFLTEGSLKEQRDRFHEAADILYGESERASAETRSLRRTARGTWLIRFDGSEASFRHSVGLSYYATLLWRPNAEVEAVELEGISPEFIGSGPEGLRKTHLPRTVHAEVEAADPEEIAEAEESDLRESAEFEAADPEEGIEKSVGQHGKLGREWTSPELRVEDGRALPRLRDDEARINAALHESRKQISKLKAKMQRELDFGSKEEADRIKEEIKRIVKSIGQYGKRGRERDDSASFEKARKRVRSSLTYAMERIAEKLPELAEYLLQHVPGTGTAFVFRPPPGDPEWLVEPGDF